MVNKAEFIEALVPRFGDRKSAATALEHVVEEIQRTVAKGDRVAITGFGVFEKRVRAARTARNPRTGESVKVKKTAVPAFRPGTGFKTVVADPKKLPKPVKAAKAAPATKTAAKTTAAKTTTKAAAKPAAKAATKTAAKPAAKKTVATKATKAAAAKTTKAAATKTAAKKTAKKAPARKR